VGDVEAALAFARNNGTVGQLITEMSYADLQCTLDDPPGYRNYWSDEHLRELPDEALDRFCERAHDMVIPSPSQQVLFLWGGAVGHGADWPGFNRDVSWACIRSECGRIPPTTTARERGRTT
jgi:hypothetical protein